MKDFESGPDDMPIPKPDEETKQEMMADVPTRTVTVGMDVDPKVRVDLVTLL